MTDKNQTDKNQTDKPLFMLSETGAHKELQRLSSLVDALIKTGATTSVATDAQKWEVGDAINALEALAGPARGRGRRIRPAGLAAPPGYAQKFGLLRETLVTGHPVARSALVDYARVAAIIPPGDALRSYPLGFFFARALSVLPDAQERLKWADIAVQKKYSVARLRAALNESRGKQAVTGDDAPGKRRGVYFCAQTGQRIVDLAAMVEVHLDRHHPAAPTPLPGRSLHAVLRFITLGALADWAAAHRAQAKPAALTAKPETHPTPTLPVPNKKS